MFSKRVFEHMTRLIVGAILAPGKRTVTSVLRVMGQSDDRHFQHDHCMLSLARWSALCGGRILLRFLWRAFVPAGPVVIGIDETIERRGAKIAAYAEIGNLQRFTDLDQLVALAGVDACLQWDFNTTLHESAGDSTSYVASTQFPASVISVGYEKIPL